ncbi:MAG: Rab family GTPase [Candidatus Odinarchaeota archaeon]
MIGSRGVGKTCLANRMGFNTFDVDTKLTIGVTFYTYDIPIIVKGFESFVRATIWVFGEGEQFKKLFPSYISGANGIFLVFDLSQMQTLLDLDWWYNKIVEYHKENCPKMLIGTKLDLIDQESEQHRNDELVIKHFLNSHEQMDFIQISAKENINVQNIFKQMVEKILNTCKLEYDKIP